MSDPIPLTDAQNRFFETFGYLGFPGLMADRIDEIIDEFEALWESRGGGHHGRPHEGTARSCIAQFIDHRGPGDPFCDEEPGHLPQVHCVCHGQDVGIHDVFRQAFHQASLLSCGFR